MPATEVAGPTADWMFTIAWAAGGNWTETFWNNARFEELLVAGRAELDEAKLGKSMGSDSEISPYKLI